MLSIGIYVMAFLVISITSFITHKWRNPSCNGKLPPGSMGLPLIGETLQFFIPSKTIDNHSFIKTRIQKYGPMFKTSLAGRPVVVLSDADFCHFLLQQEGKLVELWYMDAITKLVNISGKDGSSIIAGHVIKRLKKMVLDHFGLLNLKEKLLPELEEMVNEALSNWSSQPFVDVKQAFAEMILNFVLRRMFGYDPVKHGEIVAEELTDFLEGLMSVPLNIPGTTYHKCLQKKKTALNLIRRMIEERQASPEARRGDFLDVIVDEIKINDLLTNEIMSNFMFGLLLAAFEILSTTLTLTMIMLTELPSVVQELEKENEEILQNRENKGSNLTWKEFKSMTFTMQVINESLRMTNLGPGFLRRAIKDIHVNGYTIPKGWTIMIASSAIHMNSEIYKSPLAFDPWRWKDSATDIPAKNFIPFGSGTRLCPGYDFSRVLAVLFLHVLVSKYSWSKVQQGEIFRKPTLAFGKGYYFKVAKKSK